MLNFPIAPGNSCSSRAFGEIGQNEVNWGGKEFRRKRPLLKNVVAQRFWGHGGMAQARTAQTIVTLWTVLWVTVTLSQRVDSQEPQSQHILFEHSGLTVHIATPGDTVSTAQALSVLEESVRQLRLRVGAAKSNAALKPSADNAEELPPRIAAIIPPSADFDIGDEPAESALVDDWQFTLLPKTLFWQPALANPSEPRCYAKLSTLRNPNSKETIDTAIGTAAGLWRFSPLGLPEQGVQLDVFAVVLSRWTERRYQVNSDYRYGIPLTFAWGNMHAKIGYEHTSSHLGDDAMVRTGRTKIRNIHDDLVLGLDYRFCNALRVYGVYAYPTKRKNFDCNPHRFNWGLEWSRRETTSINGQPFAAFDMTLRAEQDYTPNSTAQIGWQWLNMDTGRSARLALEYYDGKSNLGQYFLDREHSAALGLYLDF